MAKQHHTYNKLSPRLYNSYNVWGISKIGGEILSQHIKKKPYDIVASFLYIKIEKRIL